MDPKPVDISMLERLGILGKAKQVMNVVESKEPEKKVSKSKDFDPRDSYNQSMFNESPIYNESDEKEPIYENYQPITSQGVQQNRDYTAEQVMASNLPPAVKEAMLKNPIPRLSGPPSKVSPEAIAKLTGVSPKKMIQEKQMITESTNNSDMVTLSRQQLQELIDESINRFFKQVYNKTLTEETIKKTINTLIKEGKLQTKKKMG
jgi:hypothetical protein